MISNSYKNFNEQKKFYNNLLEDSLKKIQSNNFWIDKLIDSKTDDR